MYQLNLVFSIFWEIALAFWPWLLLLAGGWVAGIALALRQPRHFCAVARYLRPRSQLMPRIGTPRIWQILTRTRP